jgi:hypothetical protein
VKPALITIEEALNETKKNDDALWQAAAFETKAAILKLKKA